MDELIVVIISQWVSKHHAVQLKYIQFLFLNYTAIKLENKNKTIISKKGK